MNRAGRIIQHVEPGEYLLCDIKNTRKQKKFVPALNFEAGIKRGLCKKQKQGGKK